MSKISNFKELKKNSSEYNNWKKKKDINMQKKVAYLKTYPIKKDEFDKEVKRAQIIINAVDAMDECSQKKAETTEFTTDMINVGVAEGGTYVSLGIGAIALLLTKGGKEAFRDVLKGNFKNFKKLTPALVAFLIPLALISTLFSFWSSKKQIEASRYGRIEAMENDLSSLNQFASLTKEQESEVNKISKTINIPNDQIKKQKEAEKLDLKESLKNVIKPDIELQDKCNKINQKLQLENASIHNLKLTEDEILQAKKDQELIHTIVEKIDIASQDYAEKAELTTNIINNIAFGAGGLMGFLTNKILSKTKLAPKASVIGVGIYFLTSILGSAFSTKIQLEASKVGRFKAKEELLKNPEQFIYVPEEKYSNINPEPQEKQKEGFIQTLKELIDDNKRYSEQTKRHSLNRLQTKKAKEKITLTSEQINRAKTLQKNVFNMFNRLDDKSQSYSETTEAVGDSVNNFVSNFFSALSTIFAGTALFSKNNKNKGVHFILMSVSMLPTLLIDIITTKAQRKASRVASMVALNETSDFRYFAPLDNDNYSQNKEVKTSNLSEINKKFIKNQTI